jgi:hypothetical protein
MREHAIILPDRDNLGNPQPAVHNALRQALISEFGGLSAFPAGGHWLDKMKRLHWEPVREYRVAFDPTPANKRKFMLIARKAWQALRQMAGYIKHGDGTVEIIELPKPEAVELPLGGKAA